MRKICSNCKEEKDIQFFHRKRDNADGYKSFCSSCSARRLKNWRHQNEGARKEHDKRYKTKYPEKIIARNIVNKAIIAGIIKKSGCEKCGGKNSQAHHPNYCFPMKVKWLCPKHHSEAHNINTEVRGHAWGNISTTGR